MKYLDELTQRMEWWGLVEYMVKHHPEIGRALELARCAEWDDEKLVLSFPDTTIGWDQRNVMCDRKLRSLLEEHLLESGHPAKVTTCIY